MITSTPLCLHRRLGLDEVTENVTLSPTLTVCEILLGIISPGKELKKKYRFGSSEKSKYHDYVVKYMQLSVLLLVVSYFKAFQSFNGSQLAKMKKKYIS